MTKWFAKAYHIDRKTEMKRFIFLTILFYTAFFTFISYSASKAYFASMASASSNTFTAASEFPTIAQPATPTTTDQPENIRLNEIQFKPTIANQEWVEVYNAADTPVDLTGWSIIDAADTTRSLTSLGTIPPNSFKTLDISAAILNNTGSETITLRNATNQTIDTHTFVGTTLTSDQTIGRNPDGTGNWKTCDASSKNVSNNGVC